MKKLLSLALALVFFALSLSFVGCAKIDTTGLLDDAPALIEKSALVNQIFFGDGIPYDEDGTPQGNFYPADTAWLDAHGLKTTTDLKTLTESVFSQEYASIILGSGIAGFPAEVGYVYPRYASSQAENLRDENETILVSSTSEFLANPIGKSTYHYDTLALVATARNYAVLSLSVTTTTLLPADERVEGADNTVTTTVTMEIKFVKEGGAWRIDSPTY
jgi:hypothetical protein